MKKPTQEKRRKRRVAIGLALSLFLTSLSLSRGQVQAEEKWTYQPEGLAELACYQEAPQQVMPEDDIRIYRRLSKYDEKIETGSFTKRNSSRKSGMGGGAEVRLMDMGFFLWYPDQADNGRIRESNIHPERQAFCLESNELLTQAQDDVDDKKETYYVYTERSELAQNALKSGYGLRDQDFTRAGQTDHYMRVNYGNGTLRAQLLRQALIWLNLKQVDEYKTVVRAEKAEDRLGALKDKNKQADSLFGSAKQRIFHLEAEASLMILRSQKKPALAFESIGSNRYRLKVVTGYSVPGTKVILPAGSPLKIDERFTKPLTVHDPCLEDGSYPLEIEVPAGTELKDYSFTISRPNYAGTVDWRIYLTKNQHIASPTSPESSGQIIGIPLLKTVQEEDQAVLTKALLTEGQSDETPKPGDETPKPGDETPKPGDETPKPGDETPKPGDEKPKPGDETPKPGDETPKPGDEAPKPGDETPKPGDEKPKPGDEKPKPGDSKGQTKEPGDTTVIDQPDLKGQAGSDEENPSKKGSQKKEEGDFLELEGEGRIRKQTGGAGTKRGKRAPKTGEEIAFIPLTGGAFLSCAGLYLLSRGKRR